MIEFKNVSKHFGTQDVLKDVSFRILASERAGIVGPNGAGKSTLFELIQGTQESDKGEVVLPKQIRLGHLRQQLNAHAVKESVLDYTAGALPKLAKIHREIDELEHRLAEEKEPDKEKALERLGELQHAYEDLGGYEMTSRAEAALTGLGFPVARLQDPFSSFSGGWQMRAELARTLIAQPDLLLLDEPSNYLDLPAVEWLQRYLRDFKGTMLLISHDRYLLETLTEVTIEVADGNIERYQGGYSYYAREREARFEQRMAAAKNQDKRRAEIERFVERFRAKNTKASQVQSRMKMLEKMESIDVSLSTQSQAPIQLPAAPHCGAEVVRLEGAGVGYADNQWVLRNVDLSLNRGDTLGLVGYNGMGKTTLLRMLAGSLEPREGKRVLGHKVVVGYQSQEFAETMPPEKSVLEIVKAASPDPQEGPIRKLLGRFGFTRESVDKPCQVLSGGEKIRLAFARIFIHPPNLLILDEPTTHLDLRGRETLQEAVKAYSGTTCFVSHDIAFVRNVATSILAITPEGVRFYPGGYDYYLEKRDPAEEITMSTGPRDADNGKAEKQARIEARKEEVRRKRQAEKSVKVAEKQIEKLEAERDDLLAELAENSESGEVNFSSLNRRLKEIAYEIDIETGKWEEAATALEEFQ